MIPYSPALLLSAATIHAYPCGKTKCEGVCGGERTEGRCCRRGEGRDNAEDVVADDEENDVGNTDEEDT